MFANIILKKQLILTVVKTSLNNFVHTPHVHVTTYIWFPPVLCIIGGLRDSTGEPWKSIIISVHIISACIKNLMSKNDIILKFCCAKPSIFHWLFWLYIFGRGLISFVINLGWTWRRPPVALHARTMQKWFTVFTVRGRCCWCGRTLAATLESEI